MATTSRRLMKLGKKHGSQTPGKSKGESCQKSPLKNWGMNAKPWKLKGEKAARYAEYCKLCDAMNKLK